MTIRGVIFDFGGVLWDMRWDLTQTLELEHGIRERAIAQTLYDSDTFRKLEVGVGDVQAWLAEAHSDLEAVAGRELPQLHRYWRERQHLIGPNIGLIRRLRPAYKTGVLSNADNTLVERLRNAGVAHLFDDIVCSADVGMAKPDARVYALAAQRLRLSPEECVFVDDLAANVDAAKAAGMEGVHFRVGQHVLEDQLAAHGVRVD